jgi:hypothetical protein
MVLTGDGGWQPTSLLAVIDDKPDVDHPHNTAYLDRAVRHLRGSGVDVPDELLAHVAPLGWEHFGLAGDYLWSEIDKPRERFRPLRLNQTGRDA